MTRIIAGDLGGRRIAVPPRGTRPTTDRVREALFSRLDHQDALHGARVLDLFAGSGALGLEALSRGATSATFVEAAASAARVITANAKELATTDRARVVKERALPFLARTTDQWDLVLIDPPYDIAAEDLAAVLEALAPRLAADAVVVLEWTSRAPQLTWPPGLVIERERDYGETRLHWARWGSVES
ncbi:16S rRNA (guanine(966)-N(2))-methyltransferase RsmD [Demequina muriae]|uniref:16S rRNA (Guanine(966)-N(2))-methyltransferase RsmD n=1 Tax=Demequina muriae TaxID=3051664 RepID=A0ABT8GIS1_9MICO|nr:16S rRNA (guanine(966)-N(2))-methyltransferase RsmD [Demequina sp. EGI L300058]MDN4481331.1 16S rRNA (guanine(966)-N(2))-methyltransferase RsmD [Demequina sp. EGI L300058]